MHRGILAKPKELTVILILLINLFYTTTVFADNEDFKILINPEKSLFTVENLAPGDKVSNKIKITNGGKKNFIYFSYAEKMSSSKNLYENLNLIIEENSNLIYVGTLKDFFSFPPRFLRNGESETLKFTLEMPLSLGNEFQGSSAEVEFKFVAEGRNTPPPPPEDCKVTNTCEPPEEECKDPKGCNPPVEECKNPKGCNPPVEECKDPKGCNPPVEECKDPKGCNPPVEECKDPKGCNPPVEECKDPKGCNPPPQEECKEGDNCNPPINEDGNDTEENSNSEQPTDGDGNSNTKNPLEGNDNQGNIEEGTSIPVGDQLPNTATNNYNLLLLGSIMIMLGGVLLIIQKRKKID
ncbi:LPXTG cell wall anchor domain-containing protein [Peribacillus acanthi]|uniref:LPXTG cell wall anchor domain-containing protein n=1 Tax=Peribacillus acanthi TaxID=2171554 RepID=UPI0013007209|nr:LPXTG cell wall anchor domain-containing protein [Peribacillus acanthi]